MSSRTTLCTAINTKFLDDFMRDYYNEILFIRSDPLNPEQLRPKSLEQLKPELDEYLKAVKYNITDPIVDFLEAQVTGIKTYVKSKIERDKLEKFESGRKIYTLKYYSAKNVPKKINGETVYKKDKNGEFKLDNGEQIPEMVPSYTKIFDNSNSVNDTRNGFTEEGFEKGKMFKKENEDYLITVPDDIHYDSLEDIQFNYKYWEEICERTRTNICLFSGATSTFNYLGEKDTTSLVNNNQYKFLKDNLSLNFYLKPCANIFLSCENLCLASKLNLESYTIPEQRLRDSAVSNRPYYNLPCIGFDDLVITYNSNIIFCRSIIPSFYPGNQDQLLEEFHLGKGLTINKNYKGCEEFAQIKKKYEFNDIGGLSRLINNYYVNEDNIKAFITKALNSGNKDEITNLLTEKADQETAENYNHLIRQKIISESEINRLKSKRVAGKPCTGQKFGEIKKKSHDKRSEEDNRLLNECEEDEDARRISEREIQALDAQIKELLNRVILRLLSGTFFNALIRREEIITRLIRDGNLNANKYRIAYKDIFLVSPHCNKCSQKRLIGIINENNSVRNRPLQEVHFVKDNKGRDLYEEGDKRKKTCIWCGNARKCLKKKNVDNIQYELGINYKIYAELLIKNNLGIITEVQRIKFYTSLNFELKELRENPQRFIRAEFLLALGQQEIIEVTVEEYEKYANTDPSLYDYDKIRRVLYSTPPSPLPRRNPLRKLPSFHGLSPRTQVAQQRPPQLIRSLNQPGGTRKYRKQNKKQSKKKKPTNSKTRRHKKSNNKRKSRK
jgi:hypothetical protein